VCTVRPQRFAAHATVAIKQPSHTDTPTQIQAQSHQYNHPHRRETMLFQLQLYFKRMRKLQTQIDRAKSVHMYGIWR